MLDMLDRLKERLERVEITPVQWTVSFACIIIGRLFLEVLSNPTSSGIIASDAPTLVHETLFFAVMALSSILILQWAIPAWKKALPVLTLFFFLWTYSAPIIDWITTAGRGRTETYMFIGSPSEWFHSFATFFGTYQGVTLGMRIELAAVIIGIGILVYLIRKNMWRAVVTSLMIYLVIFIAGSLPSVLNIIPSITQSTTLTDNIHGTLRYASMQRLLEIGFDFMMGRIWFITSLILGLVWLLTNLKSRTVAVFKNSRPGVAVLYVGLALFGAFLAYRSSPFSMNWDDWLTLSALGLAFYFSWMYAACENDIHDADIDVMTNSFRPLPSGSLTMKEMRTASLLFLAASLIAGFLSGYYAFYLVLVYDAFAYIYSAPPMRLRRFPLVPILIMSACTVMAVLAGFFTFSVDKHISAFSPALIAGIFVFYFLSMHMKDLKDVEGDRLAGVRTVPVMLGPVWGPRAVGAMNFLAYMIIPFVLGDMLLFVGALPAGLLTYAVAVRKPYKDKIGFGIYGLFTIFMLAVLFLRR